MNIILYKNSASDNKVDKSNNLSKELVIENVRFLDSGDLSVLTPSVLLNISSEISDIMIYNYMKIPKLNRFYFIDKISTSGGLIRIDGRCDVLYSHKDDILASKQYIIRQENKNNSPYLDDNMLPIRSDHNYIAKPFGDDVDDRTCGRIILATTGKGGTVI